MWAEMLRDLLVSNAGLHEAIGKSARVAPAAIRGEVKALYVRAQRGELSSALSRFADEMDDAIADTVVTALQIADQRAVSDLGAMLAAVATSTRETVAMQLRINAARARTYRTAQLIAGIVTFFVLLLVATNPDYMEPFGTVVGQLVLAAVGGLDRGVDLGDGRALPSGAGTSPAARARACRRRSAGMIWAAVLAGALGTGVWIIARALVPPARPLRALAEELVEPRAVTSVRPFDSTAARKRSHQLAARLAGAPSERLAADLAVLGRTGERYVLDKLAYALLFLALALVPAVLFAVLDVGVPALTSLVGAVLFAAAGWFYPDVDVRSRALAARRAWSSALTVYVDIVGISLAGGAGVEDALMVAASAGTGPQFERLNATLRAAQTRRRKLWHALDELGATADIVPLRELAAAVDLAAESGSRIRETLLAKANAMRIRQLTDAEADAQKASETMGIAPALMAIAAVVIIGYPAVARFFE